MLEVQKLSKSYGKSLAVDEVSFFVPDGTVGILLGPNGAGKSTIIKSIAGLLRYQGRIGIQGLPARSVEAKRQFAYVPEMPAMFDALSVREHIEYMRKAYNSGITDEEVEAELQKNAADYGYDDVEEYKSAIDLKGYKEYMMTEKVLSFLFDNAVVTDTEPVQELNTEGTTETATQTAETETEGTETAGTETGAAEETESAAGTQAADKK